MSRVIGVLALVAVVGVGLYIGCGPRGQVAKDKALAKIDELLGDLNVKLKEVENAYDEAEEATAGLREKRIEAQVRVESMNKKKDELQAQRERLISDLGKLKGMLGEAEGSGKIERNGKEISLEQLKNLADGIVKQMKSVKDQMTKNDVIASAWTKNLDLLTKNYETSKSQLAQLENQIDEIRSKKSSLDAMKEAATIMGPEVSISDKFDDLTKEVDELLVNVDTQWRVEEAKLDDRMAEVQQENMLSLEELLDDKTDVSSTLSEIDKLLEAEGTSVDDIDLESGGSDDDSSEDSDDSEQSSNE